MPHDSALPDGVPDGPLALGRSAVDRRFDDALEATPSRYHPGRQTAMRELEAAVGAIVDELRGRGLEPERVLVIVKAHVAARAAHPHDVLDDVVRWCITRYFQDQPARDGA